MGVVEPAGIEVEGLTDLVLVGRGGFARVYRAHQTSLRRDVALKVISASLSDEGSRRRFERECEAVGRLSWHPNVVSVFDAGVTDAGDAYLVMELLPDGSLGDRLERGGPLPVEEAVAAIVPVADALQAAHEAGLLHRDVKPENVLVGPRGVPKLADFGIVQIEDRSRSVTGAVTASLYHAAPELLSGQPSVATDVYALGSTLFTLLAGSPPFYDPDDEVMTTLVARILQGPVPDLRGHGVPDHVCRAVERALAKEPGDRWSSAAAFAEALSAGHQAPAPAPPPLVVDLDDGPVGKETRPVAAVPPAPGAVSGSVPPERYDASGSPASSAPPVPPASVSPASVSPASGPPPPVGSSRARAGGGRGKLVVTLSGIVAVLVLVAVVARFTQDDGDGDAVVAVDRTTPPATEERPETDDPARDPATVPVFVGNGSGVSGEAGEITEDLRRAGYTAALEPGNATATDITQVFYVDGDWEAEAEAVAEAIGLGADRAVPWPEPPPFGEVPPEATVIVQVGTDVADGP